MTEESPQRLALFPLHTVLFPGCYLPLQIFEQRYLRLVKECMRDETGFVVVLIHEGKEVGASPEIFSIGTYVEISDWKTLDNGLLGISIQSKYRVRIDQPSAQDDGLLTASIHSHPVQGEQEHLLDEYNEFADMLKVLEEHPYAQQFPVDVDYEDTAAVIHRLAFLLPISEQQKQSILEMDNTRARCERLRTILASLQNLGNS